MKKLLSLFLALALVCGISTSAFATDITGSGNAGASEVKVNQDASLFSVIVPTNLPVSIDADGKVTTSSSVYIYNDSYGPVLIKDVKVVTANGWALAPFSTDFKTQKVGIKQFGLTLNSEAVGTSGTISLNRTNWPSIPGWDAMKLSYTANVAAQNAAMTNTTIANIIITVGWDSVSSGEYVLADDSDFDGTSDGNFTYIGSDEYVEVPSIIKGVTLTSLDAMFYYNETVKGVRLPNSNSITSMIVACAYSTVEEVLSFPPQVIDMTSAFEGCEHLISVPELPSNLSDITNLFYGCVNLKKAPAIPVSVSYMSYAFADCESLCGVIWIYANPSYYDGFFQGTSTKDGITLTVMGPTEQYSQILATRSSNSHIYPPV